MEQISNDTWETMFGYKPNRELKRMILEEVKNTGCDIRESVSRYKLPELAVLDSNGKFFSEEHGGRITPEQWYERNPLGRFGNLKLITSRHYNTNTNI